MIAELPCPACRTKVYAPGDSDRERIDCTMCGAILTTKQADGQVAVELDQGATDRLTEALSEVGAKYKPGDDWQGRVWSEIPKTDRSKP